MSYSHLCRCSGIGPSTTALSESRRSLKSRWCTESDRSSDQRCYEMSACSGHVLDRQRPGRTLVYAVLSIRLTDVPTVQSKRIQIRLLHDQDWDVVIKLLRDLRCPMRESQDRPSTAGGPFPVSNHRASGEFSVAADRPEPTRPDSASASLANRSQPSFSGLRVPHPPQSYTNSRQQPATHEFPSNLEQPLSTPFAESSYKYQPSNLQTPMLHNGDGFLSMFPRSNPFGNPDIDTPAPESLGLSAGTLSQMLPPRRELPFPDRPSSSPTKPKTGVRRSRPVSTSSTSNKRPKTSAKPPAPRTSTAKVAQPIEAPKTPSALNSLDPNSTSSSRRPSANLPSTAEGVPPSGHSVSSPRTENEQIATLQAYASKPSRDRQILIDNMITQYIGDDSFTTLCEDVENAWKRIGLDAGS